MAADLKTILDCVLTFIALINPISKIFLLSTLSEKTTGADIRRIAVKSTVIAAVILLSFVFIGNFILTSIFHVQIYSFKIVGGLVLFFRGFEALNKGLFFELNEKQKLEEMSIVPLASPMIAGPATIAASVSFPATYGAATTSLSVLAAVAVNLSVMLASRYISRFLDRHHIMGALIRITGLIVATIGIQMVLDGIGDYLKASGIVTAASL
ncbi:MAG TPA: MarC family protein [Spirochaetota bacterium]|nr:MarC family protein [Spirochaetota bacterium]HPC41266.1 MarC family protein [Spirochaetota bacterium]HPL15695.1 MarC family protein [Spirochaetota bacterium]HQF08122.1 MarC family protein [Spirochaetota bacterium]HQH96991.1 MarC family protein [Spirochaetota bacterium]